MTAYRVVDDHKELDNVGSNTHDQIDTHISTTPFIIVSGAVGNIPANARLLTGSGVTITDGGPGGNLTLTVIGGGGGSGTPGGNDTEVQFNDGGVFGGDTNFTFNKTTNTLSVNNVSGSLTRLVDGTSYLVAGSNVTIVTGSNGSVTISAPTQQISWMEIPTGDADGINNVFTLSNTPMPTSAVMFYINGVLQRQGASADYTISTNTITMNYIPNSGSNVVTTYPY